jgi:hypothetical protein
MIVLGCGKDEPRAWVAQHCCEAVPEVVDLSNAKAAMGAPNGEQAFARSDEDAVGLG